MVVNTIFNVFTEGDFLMRNLIFYTASFLGALSIILGAFGTHMFEDYLLQNNRLNTFEIAVRYQFYHVFFLLFIGLVYEMFNKKILKYAFFLVLTGILLFSGSLYLICFTNNGFLGIITPFGGLALIMSWVCLFLSISKAE